MNIKGAIGGYASGVLGAFAAAILFGVLGGEFWQAALLARAMLALTLLIFGVWFISAFVTSDLRRSRARPAGASGAAVEASATEQESEVKDVFRFAYVFALVALALLVLPFTSMVNTRSLPDGGPIRMLSGCVVSARAASAPAAAASNPLRHAPALPLCSEAAEANSYPLLVGIGGVVGRGRCANEQSSDCLQPQGRSLRDLVGSGSPREPAADVQPHFEISSGLVVPLYVVVLGFVGGAISLTRRIPEYQKRTEAAYNGTDKEPRLEPYEAREFVVFQILQLVTAPFLAIVGFYVFDPDTATSAAAYAFVGGFLSEWLLLRVRAVVEGPGPVRTEAAQRQRGDLAVRVVRAGKAEPGATVSVFGAATQSLLSSSRSDAEGRVAFVDLEAATVRVAASNDAGWQASMPSVKVQRAGAQIELTLVQPPPQ